MQEIKIKKVQLWQGLSVLLIVLLVVSVLTNGFKIFHSLDKNAAKEKTQKFLDVVLAGKGEVKITDLKEDKGLYQVVVNLNGQEFNSYLSKDGSLFFPSVIMLDKLDNNIYGSQTIGTNKSNKTLN